MNIGFGQFPWSVPEFHFLHKDFRRIDILVVVIIVMADGSFVSEIEKFYVAIQQEEFKIVIAMLAFNSED